MTSDNFFTSYYMPGTVLIMDVIPLNFSSRPKIFSSFIEKLVNILEYIFEGLFHLPVP